MASYLPLTLANAQTEPNSGVKYWVIFPAGYREQYTQNSGNITIVNMIVAWEDAADWKKGMMGHTEGYVAATYLHRTNPHQNPYASKQYVQNITLVDQFATQDQLAATAAEDKPWALDPVYDNWPIGGFIVYEVTYTNYPYVISPDSSLGSSLELARYIRKTRRSIPKELSRAAKNYETCEATPTNIPEVGFIPFIEEELVYTWFQVPIDVIPDAAIANCGGRCNSATFDSRAVETMLFRGLAAPIEPYPGPSGELYANLMYTFAFLPNGWNYLPLNVTSGGGDFVWTRVRKRGSASGTSPGEPLYPSVDFAGLFKPRAS